MTLERHDAIREPPLDTTIWRYYPTSQFIWVLRERALYLSRLDQLEDPFEGYSPIKNLQKEIENQRERSEFFRELPNEIDLGEPGERTKRSYELMRRLSLVNCWSIGEEDSLAMWKSYLRNGDGIAVRSTFGDLVNAIDQETSFSYHAGKMTYFDYFDDFKSVNNFFSFIMSKPRQYVYENELRVFVWWPTSGEVDFADRELGESVGMDTLTAPSGTEIGVNLNTLIDGVFVSPFGPSWLTPECISDLLDKYGVEANAEISQLAMEPADILEED